MLASQVGSDYRRTRAMTGMTANTQRREFARFAETARVRWWPAALAFVALGMTYALVSDRLTLGPPWWPFVLAVVAVAGARVLRWRGQMHATRLVALATLAAITVA